MNAKHHPGRWRSTIRVIPRWVAGHLLPRVSYPVLTGPLRGARFVLGSLSGAGGGASVYVNQMEVEQTAALTAHLRPGNVVFDIGANVGYYSVLASRYVGEHGFVLSIEPVVRNVYFLFEHVRSNRLQNVAILPAACGSVDGMAIFEGGDNYAMGENREGGWGSITASNRRRWVKSLGSCAVGDGRHHLQIGWIEAGRDQG